MSPIHKHVSIFYKNISYISQGEF